MKNGGVNAVLIDTIMAEIYCRQNDDIVYQKVDGTEEDTVYCIEKGNAELLNTVNKGLKKLKDNGEYDQIYENFSQEKMCIRDRQYAEQLKSYALRDFL